MPSPRLKTPLQTTPWVFMAACRDADPALFFPPKEKTQTGRAVPEAYIKGREYCNHCSCKKACLEFALEQHIEYGLWGGLTWPERRRIIKARTKTYTTDILVVD